MEENFSEEQEEGEEEEIQEGMEMDEEESSNHKTARKRLVPPGGETSSKRKKRKILMSPESEEAYQENTREGIPQTSAYPSSLTLFMNSYEEILEPIRTLPQQKIEKIQKRIFNNSQEVTAQDFFTLGFLYFTGEHAFIGKDEEKAMEFFKKAKGRNHIATNQFLAAYYLRSEEIYNEHKALLEKIYVCQLVDYKSRWQKKNKQFLFDLYIHAFRNKIILVEEAKVFLNMLQTQIFNMKGIDKEALIMTADAQYALADMCNTEKNVEKAAEIYCNIAVNTGGFYHREENYSEAFENFLFFAEYLRDEVYFHTQKKITQEILLSTTELLGKYYESGIGINTNHEKAVEWYNFVIETADDDIIAKNACWFHLSRLELLNNNDSEKALSYLEKAFCEEEKIIPLIAQLTEEIEQELKDIRENGETEDAIENSPETKNVTIRTLLARYENSCILSMAYQVGIYFLTQDTEKQKEYAEKAESIKHHLINYYDLSQEEIEGIDKDLFLLTTLDIQNSSHSKAQPFCADIFPPNFDKFPYNKKEPLNITNGIDLSEAPFIKTLNTHTKINKGKWGEYFTYCTLFSYYKNKYVPLEDEHTNINFTEKMFTIRGKKQTESREVTVVWNEQMNRTENKDRDFDIEKKRNNEGVTRYIEVKTGKNKLEFTRNELFLMFKHKENANKKEKLSARYFIHKINDAGKATANIEVIKNPAEQLAQEFIALYDGKAFARNEGLFSTIRLSKTKLGNSSNNEEMEGFPVDIQEKGKERLPEDVLHSENPPSHGSNEATHLIEENRKLLVELEQLRKITTYFLPHKKVILAQACVRGFLVRLAYRKQIAEIAKKGGEYGGRLFAENKYDEAMQLAKNLKNRQYSQVKKMIFDMDKLEEGSTKQVFKK